MVVGYHTVREAKDAIMVQWLDLGDFPSQQRGRHRRLGRSVSPSIEVQFEEVYDSIQATRKHPEPDRGRVCGPIHAWWRGFREFRGDLTPSARFNYRDAQWWFRGYYFAHLITFYRKFN